MGVAAAAALGAVGCEATEEFEAVPVEEVAAETQINALMDALADEDYAAACDPLTPRGFYHLVTGEQRDFPDDRNIVDCEAKLELAIRTSDVDFSGVGNVVIEDSHTEGDELVVEDSDGAEWRLTPDGKRITAVPR